MRSQVRKTVRDNSRDVPQNIAGRVVRSHESEAGHRQTDGQQEVRSYETIRDHGQIFR
jgi:hypothetical protein